MTSRSRYYEIQFTNMTIINSISQMSFFNAALKNWDHLRSFAFFLHTSLISEDVRMIRFQTTRDSSNCLEMKARSLNAFNYFQSRALRILFLHWNIDVFVYEANFCRQSFFAYIVLLWYDLSTFLLFTLATLDRFSENAAMIKHNLELQFNMNDLRENDKDERECADADENEHERRRK